MSVVSIERDALGTADARYLIALAKANGGVFGALDLVKSEAHQLRSTPHVEKALAARIEKSVAGGTTTGTHWADDLVPYIGFDMIRLWNARSMAMRVLTAGAQLVGWLENSITGDATQAVSAYWHQEGAARPLTKAVTAAHPLTFASLDATAVITREAARFGRNAEANVTALLSDAVVRKLDTSFLDPSNAGGSGEPAAVTYGATSITSTGSTAAQIITDLSGMIAALASAGKALVWSMPALTFATIAAKLAGVGSVVSRDALFGIPVVTGWTGPRQITLMDASTLSYAQDEQAVLDASRVASLEMVDSTSQSAASGTGAQAVSLWQTGGVGLKASMAINWTVLLTNSGSPTQPSGVVSMTVAY